MPIARTSRQPGLSFSKHSKQYSWHLDGRNGSVVPSGTLRTLTNTVRRRSSSMGTMLLRAPLPMGPPAGSTPTRRAGSKVFLRCSLFCRHWELTSQDGYRGWWNLDLANGPWNDDIRFDDDHQTLHGYPTMGSFGDGTCWCRRTSGLGLRADSASRLGTLRRSRRCCGPC